MGIETRCAVAVGYQGFGAIPLFAERLPYYGYERLIAIVDDASCYAAIARKYRNVSIEEVPHLLEPDALEKAASAAGVGSDRVPFFCVTDRVMFSYLAVAERLKITNFGLHLPFDPIRRARLKPHIRHVLNKCQADDTRWLSLTNGRSNNLTDEQIAILKTFPEGRFVVKPIAGFGSEYVQLIDEVDEIPAAAARIRTYFANLPAELPHAVELHCDGLQYNPFADVLVEERLAGTEYVVDGVIQNGRLGIAIQQKVTRVVKPFVGDGLIVSPPDYTSDSTRFAIDGDLQTSLPCYTSESKFKEFMAAIVAAIGLDNWVFHAEVMETPRGLRLVELNPRFGGGLLWQSAGYHLGLDSVELLIRCHLGIPTLAASSDCVTGQFPIYADQLGVVDSVVGVNEAEAVPFVERVVVAIQPGTSIRDLSRENYAAFVLVRAPTHCGARQAHEKARTLLSVKYQ